MTSVRKRKMARSSVSKNTRRVKDKQRDIRMHSNPIVTAHWDHSLTLQQNYKKLGLRAKLGGLAGGAEKKIVKRTDTVEDNDDNEEKPSIEDIEQTEDPAQIPEGEARIIRDPETNEVVKVIYGTMKPGQSSEQKEESEVIKKLQEQAIKNAAIVKERTQSERESEWLKSLYEKHGDDYQKMMWDKKLNVFQQSAGDLNRRVNKWKKANNI